mmetsp:Transcript_22751/g.41132  ORF Transcript_22751/g.41132 Transcript_22751/m.41132 type:complete len:201 (-) Transcript_22751:87-689(-)
MTTLLECLGCLVELRMIIVTGIQTRPRVLLQHCNIGLVFKCGSKQGFQLIGNSVWGIQIIIVHLNHMWCTGQLHCLVAFGPNGHASFRVMIHQRMLACIILIVVGDGQTILELRRVVRTVPRIVHHHDLQPTHILLQGQLTQGMTQQPRPLICHHHDRHQWRIIIIYIRRYRHRRRIIICFCFILSLVIKGRKKKRIPSY